MKAIVQTAPEPRSVAVDERERPTLDATNPKTIAPRTTRTAAVSASIGRA